MKLHRSLVLALCLALCAALSIGGTLAYLTDRDSEINVFTMGDVRIDLTEEFDQGVQLVPGLNVEKTPVITNIGTVDAYVWMTFSVPASFDTDGIEWQFDNLGEEWIAHKEVVEEINGVQYVTRTFLYKDALAPNAVTATGLYEVGLDQWLDIDPNGNVHHVQEGNVTDLGWNMNDDGYPVVYVAAYAVQKEGMADVTAAYEKYIEQWGANGGVDYGTITTPAEAQAAIWAAGEGDTLILGAGTYPELVIENEDGSPKTNFTLAGSAGTKVGYINLNGSTNTTLANIIFDAAEAKTAYMYDGTANGKANVVLGSKGLKKGAKNVTIKNCVFDGESPEGYVAISGLERRRPSGSASNITVEGCTFLADASYYIYMHYPTTGFIDVKNNTFGGEGSEYNYGFWCTGNNSNLTFTGNTFKPSVSGAFIGSGANNGNVLVTVEDNSFTNDKAANALALMASYTNSGNVSFKNNTFGGALADLTIDELFIHAGW